MQVVSDEIKDAASVLNEMLALTDKAGVLASACLPVKEYMKTATTRKSPAVYVAESGKKLRDNFISDFESEFPYVSRGVANGWLGSASYRINDGMYKLGNALLSIKQKKYMIMSDKDRADLWNMLCDVEADFAIYTIMTFKLYDLSKGNIPMSVYGLCERNGITPEVFYGMLLESLRASGRTYYAYEQLSPLYSDMLAAESEFMATCEEQELPLTEEMASDILEGKVSSEAVLNRLMKENADMETKEVKMTPSGLISRMNLE